MKEILNQLSETVNRRIESDEKYRKKLGKVTKTFCITFDGKESYNFSLDNGKISEIQDGRKDSDIMVNVDSDTFRKILSKEIDPLSAYIEKKITVKASLLDKLLITELFK
ncbi:MAG: SCP2 sterol-binding domain-containing protein [Candidatus Thermoplasmatota archaeon]|nr:SCP2 sterol-binding domain-containing protein [Candidatus Thermoplasmatota archaeon]